MTELAKEILVVARQMFVESCHRSHVVEKAALSGAYDKGTWITQFIPAAEIQVLKHREEMESE
jgi:hypothetical protein